MTQMHWKAQMPKSKTDRAITPKICLMLGDLIQRNLPQRILQVKTHNKPIWGDKRKDKHLSQRRFSLSIKANAHRLSHHMHFRREPANLWLMITPKAVLDQSRLKTAFRLKRRRQRISPWWIHFYQYRWYLSKNCPFQELLLGRQAIA